MAALVVFLTLDLSGCLGLAEEPSSTTPDTVPKDSLPVDTVPKDTLPKDTFPKDTLPPQASFAFDSLKKGDTAIYRLKANELDGENDQVDTGHLSLSIDSVSPEAGTLYYGVTGIMRSIKTKRADKSIIFDTIATIHGKGMLQSSDRSLQETIALRNVAHSTLVYTDFFPGTTLFKAKDRTTPIKYGDAYFGYFTESPGAQLYDAYLYPQGLLVYSRIIDAHCCPLNSQEIVLEKLNGLAVEFDFQSIQLVQ